jgi:hypothetical protein
MIYKIFRKNLFIYFILLIMIVSVIFYTILFSKANNSPIDLITVKGNKKLIEDIKIQGLLGDSKANYIFNIEGNKMDIKPFTGTSGIYEIDSFDKGNVKIVTDRITDKDTVIFSKDGFKKLADINLEDGKIQVKGLYGDGDNLYIVIIENNKLAVRLFNLKEEKFTDEVIVYEDNVYEVTDNKVKYKFNLEYGRLYENRLSIVMAFENTTKIVTVEYKDKLSKVSDIDIDYNFILDHRNDDYTKPYDVREGRIYDVIFKNDLLYIIDGQKLYVTHYINGINRIIDYNLNLSAYNKAGELKYSGKIESGVNDDNISESTMSVALKEKFVKTADRRVYYDVKFR